MGNNKLGRETAAEQKRADVDDDLILCLELMSGIMLRQFVCSVCPYVR